MSAITHPTAGGLIQAGCQNPIELPTVTYEEFQKSLGPKITHGDNGQIHEVLGSDGKRIYKIIPLENFKNGDEIRISEIASRLRVAPQFHQAFSLDAGEKQFVVIEMDHGGKSLGTHMEDVGSKTAEPEPDADTDSLDHLPPQFREMIRQMQANDPFKVTVIKKPPKASIEDTLTAIYEGKVETFYFQLFSRIKALAEAKVSFADTHVGNILPNPQKADGLRLIDFDAASIESSVDIAKARSLSGYTLVHLQGFQALPGLSSESQSLIKWF
ncbi:hypothetical protein [Simkania negevensis]|uniref:Uncharacterized protein n=1 Tax=Simkania negevensis (strain ATCC VR-1471 / DSM 27360 / Z) TaxID=331113 RepID=F8L3S0_SIMNZ|nr:hypothetical protein [Simkania negevensis]CCB89937.1 unknown protein [Simkania negevensis Z]